MTSTLLAYLYPRIKGSQEDVATFSLAYVLEQSTVLNESFTKLIQEKLHSEIRDKVIYRCQDSDKEFGRPDITGYVNGQLRIICEAKFYAGLTVNQPVSYLKRLTDCEDAGLVFICPKQRIISLWDKLRGLASGAGYIIEDIDECCVNCGKIRMAIVSWNVIMEELILTASEQDPQRLSDLNQLQGFCERIESEAFVPFRPEEFSAQTARDIDRYYEVVDATYEVLKSHKELSANPKGLRGSPRWQGYSQYLSLMGLGVSIDYIRKLWKSPSSIETPFWFHLSEIKNGKWVCSNDLQKYMSSIDARLQDDFYGTQYLALIPKPYVTLDEMAEDFSQQIIGRVQDYLRVRKGDEQGKIHD